MLESVQISSPLYQQLSEKFDALNSPSSDEHEAIISLRREAWKNFNALGFPTTKAEDWKYTNINRFLKEDYYSNNLIQAKDISIKDAVIKSLDCYRVVLLNGELQIALSELPNAKQVKILPITNAIDRSAFAHHFNKYINTSKQHFAALNTALFSGGLFIEVAANITLDKPLQIVYVLSGEKNSLQQSRNLIVLGNNAAMNLIETVISQTSDGADFRNHVSEIVLQRNAQLTHYSVQAGKNNIREIHQAEVQQQQNTLYNNFTFTISAAELVRNNLHVTQAGEGAETHMYGLYLAAGNQLIDNHTAMHHNVPQGNSNELYKGIMAGEASGIFNGKIYIHKDAQKINAFQLNNNLMLSNKAVANSKPQLEIYADDVKCSHGSTIGQFDPDAKFYLQTRGISESSARKLLIAAFAFDITSRVNIPELRTFINEKIGQYLDAINNI